MEEWETLRRWRYEETSCSFQVSAVENHLHIPPPIFPECCQEMVTLEPAPAKNSSSFVQFERTSSCFAPVTVRVAGFAGGRGEVDGEEVEGVVEEKKKERHSRRSLILRKTS